MMSLAYSAGELFIAALFKCPVFSISYSSLPILKGLVRNEASTEVMSYIDLESESDPLFIFKKFPDVFVFKQDCLTFTDAFLSLCAHQKSLRTSQSFYSRDYLENAAVAYFCKKLKHYGSQHFLTLFSVFVKDKTQPLHSQFHSYSILDAFTFFQAHSDIFVITNENVSLKKHEPAVQNHLLSDKLIPETMKHFSEAVYFLLTCFKSLHYIELKQCISYVMRTVGEILNEYSLLKQRELFESLPLVRMNEFGFLTLKSTNVFLSMPKTIQVNLTIVCLLAFYREAHIVAIIEEVSSKIPSSSNIFSGLSFPEQINFFRKYPEYFIVLPDHCVSLLPTFVFPVCSFQMPNVAGVTKNEDSKSKLVPDNPTRKPLSNDQNAKLVDTEKAADASKQKDSASITSSTMNALRDFTMIKIVSSSEAVKLLGGDQAAKLLDTKQNNNISVSKENGSSQIINSSTNVFSNSENEESKLTSVNVDNEQKSNLGSKKNNLPQVNSSFTNASCNSELKSSKSEISPPIKKSGTDNQNTKLPHNEQTKQNNSSSASKKNSSPEINNSSTDTFSNSKNINSQSKSVDNSYKKLLRVEQRLKQLDTTQGNSSNASMKQLLPQTSENSKSKLKSVNSHSSPSEPLNSDLNVFDAIQNNSSCDFKKIDLPQIIDFSTINTNCEKYFRTLDMLEFLNRRIRISILFLLKHFSCLNRECVLKTLLHVLNDVRVSFLSFPPSDKSDFITVCCQFINALLDHKVEYDIDAMLKDIKKEIPLLFSTYCLTGTEKMHFQKILRQMAQNRISCPVVSAPASEQFKFFKEVPLYLEIGGDGFLCLAQTFGSISSLVDSFSNFLSGRRCKSKYLMLHQTDKKVSKSDISAWNGLSQASSTEIKSSKSYVKPVEKKKDEVVIKLSHVDQFSIPEAMFQILHSSRDFLGKYIKDVVTEHALAASLYCLHELYTFFYNLSKVNQNIFIQKGYQSLKTRVSSHDDNKHLTRNIDERMFLFSTYLLAKKDCIHFQKIFYELKYMGAVPSDYLKSVSKQFKYFKDSSKYFDIGSNGYVALNASFYSLKNIIDVAISLTTDSAKGDSNNSRSASNKPRENRSRKSTSISEFSGSNSASSGGSQSKRSQGKSLQPANGPEMKECTSTCPPVASVICKALDTVQSCQKKISQPHLKSIQRLLTKNASNKQSKSNSGSVSTIANNSSDNKLYSWSTESKVDKTSKNVSHSKSVMNVQTECELEKRTVTISNTGSKMDNQVPASPKLTELNKEKAYFNDHMNCAKEITTLSSKLHGVHMRQPHSKAEFEASTNSDCISLSSNKSGAYGRKLSLELNYEPKELTEKMSPKFPTSKEVFGETYTAPAKSVIFTTSQNTKDSSVQMTDEINDSASALENYKFRMLSQNINLTKMFESSIARSKSAFAISESIENSHPSMDCLKKLKLESCSDNPLDSNLAYPNRNYSNSMGDNSTVPDNVPSTTQNPISESVNISSYESSSDLNCYTSTCDSVDEAYISELIDSFLEKPVIDSTETSSDKRASSTVDIHTSKTFPSSASEEISNVSQSSLPEVLKQDSSSMSSLEVGYKPTLVPDIYTFKTSSYFASVEPSNSHKSVLPEVLEKDSSSKSSIEVGSNLILVPVINTYEVIPYFASVELSNSHKSLLPEVSKKDSSTESSIEVYSESTLVPDINTFKTVPYSTCKELSNGYQSSLEVLKKDSSSESSVEVDFDSTVAPNVNTSKTIPYSTSEELSNGYQSSLPEVLKQDSSSESSFEVDSESILVPNRSTPKLIEIKELRAVNFFHILLQNYKNYHSGVSVDFLKKHLILASPEVQSVISESFQNDLLSFFQKHDGQFYVSPKSHHIYLQNNLSD